MLKVRHMGDRPFTELAVSAIALLELNQPVLRLLAIFSMSLAISVQA
jgi:hypothetical protein